MATAARRARGHRFRAPPPTPVATGKGSRSAAVDDWVLAEYLERSLKVPDLTLPESCFPTKSPVKDPPEVDLPALLAGEESAVRRVLAAATELGAFRIGGGGKAWAAEEVRAAAKAGGGVFGVTGELGRWLGLRDGIGEEFYWMRPTRTEDEKVLEEALGDTYPTLREKMENVAVKMEMVAESISKVLSEHIRNQRCSMEIARNPSILCLRKYDSHDIQANRSENSHAKSPHSYALSLHISGDDHKFWIRSPVGSACFELPAGCILVTIGRKLQEWSNGEFKSAIGETLFELRDDPNPSFSLEFLCTPLVLCRKLDHEIRKIDPSRVGWTQFEAWVETLLCFKVEKNQEAHRIEQPAPFTSPSIGFEEQHCNKSKAAAADVKVNGQTTAAGDYVVFVCAYNRAELLC